jgi:arylsulfatase
MNQPNVLFIVSDQHNAKVLGHEGHPDVKTPHLDRMAKEGTRFSCCIKQSPICTPSRVSFLSGQYCHNHGYYGLSGGNPGGLPTVLGHFRKAGYTTCALGKIHCPENWVEADSDVFHETCETSAGGRSPAYKAYLEAQGKTELEDHARLPEFGDQGRQSMEGRPSSLSFEESQEGWIANTAIDVIDQAVEAEKPFFIHASLPRPHQCTAPSQTFWDLYEGVDLTLPGNADRDQKGKAPHLKRTAENWRGDHWALLEPKTFEAARLRKPRGYLAAVSQVDAAVGRLLDHLQDRGLAENTIVIYTSDHGDYACEHDVMEKAPGICSDAITRVPMIWWGGEAVAQGHISDELVELIDVTTTVCDLAGLDPMETSDGKCISHLVSGESGAVREMAVTEFAWSKSVRKGDWRYVYYTPEMFPEEYPDGFGELYNLTADPWELNNLYFDADQQVRVGEMKSALLDWLITTTRPGTVLQANCGRKSFDNASDQVEERFKAYVNRDGKIHPDMLKKIAGGNYL